MASAISFCKELGDFTMKYISRRQFLKASTACVMGASIASLLSACNILRSPVFMDQTANNLSILSRAGIAADQVRVHIPGIQREYHYVVVNDLHITIVNEEIREEKYEDAQFRYENYFINPKGDKAYKLWERIVKAINKLDIDGVILAADMIDFYSGANMACLQDGCEKLQVPFMFLRADHDYSDGYVQETSWEMIEAAHKIIDDHQEVMVMEQDEFLIVGVNNTTSQLTETALTALEALFASGKPIVLVMHVPFASQVDEGLGMASREKWNDQELTWGYSGVPYDADEYGERLLDLVYAPDSPVVEVLAGHLHIPYDGPLTETVHQHVFDASHKGTLGYVVIGPEV